MIIGFILVFIVLFNQDIRAKIGAATGYVFDPVIGFEGQYPVLTIFLCGAIMVFFSSLLRHIFTDWKKTARVQATMQTFQKEFREAKLSNNTYKLKKLTEMQPEIMKLQTGMSSGQMKPTIITMLVVIPIFTWLWSGFIGNPEVVSYPYFDTPWAFHASFFKSTVFPNWVLIYMTLSIPLSQVLQRAFKMVSWSAWWTRIKEKRFKRPSTI